MKLCIIFRILLASTVPFLGVLVRARAADAPLAADVIIYNAKVVTVSSNFGLGQSIAVRGEQIVAVGKDRQLARYEGPKTRKVDAHGATVMPGLCDGEVDSYDAAVSELNGAAPAIHSIAEGLAYIRGEAAQKASNGWIVVERVYPTRVKEGRLPTKAELDAAAPKHPVFWDCGNLAVINSKAIQLCKLTSNTKNPPGGEIVQDPESRQLTGLLRNAASVLNLPPAHPPTASQRRAALKQLYQSYNEEGITSITENHAGTAAIDLFRELDEAAELTVRITCTRPIDPADTIEESLARLQAVTNAPTRKMPYGPTGVGDDWVRIGALKATLDGDVATGSAYLRTPWGIGATYQISEPAFRGDLWENPEMLPQLMRKAADDGWQISADCTGDACLDQLLNCYQSVQFKTDIRRRRFLINHASFQAAQDFERCRELGIAANLQPVSLYLDGDSLKKTLDERRLKYFFPLKSWFGAGLVIGAGSGHEAGLDPLAANNPWNPWLGLWITLARQTSSGAEIYPEEKLTREQAIRLYTINHAWLNFQEKKLGSLEAGKLADLIVLDKDILKCPVDDIRNVKVRLTMVGGKIVWEAK